MEHSDEDNTCADAATETNVEDNTSSNMFATCAIMTSNLQKITELTHILNEIKQEISERHSQIDKLTTTLILKYDTVMLMRVFIDAPEEERALIRQQYDKKWTQPTDEFPNAGLDLITRPAIIHPHQSAYGYSYKLDYKLKVSAYLCNKNGSIYPTGFYLYPRSSISKTNFRLANSTGIIDSGYRGNLIAILDAIKSPYSAPHSAPVAGERYVQICAPNLCPIVYQFVDSIEELGTPTERGDGGFGSTGK